MVRFVARFSVLSLLATLLAISASSATLSAAPTVIASDVTAGASVNLTSFTDDPAVPFSSAGDGFQQYQRGVSASIPFSLADDSLAGFPTDSLGIVDENDTDPFFGATDTVNADTTGPVVATWVFDISSGAAPLTLSIDMGAMGDFESSDSFEWTYAIDGAAPVSAFSLSADEDATRTYTLAGGASFDLADPLNVGATELSNVFSTVSTELTGAGSELVLTLTVSTDGGSEAVAFRNIVISSDDGGTTGPMPGDLVITEIMQNPNAVSDSSGEWFEIQNISTADIDIDGWTIADEGSDNHVITNGGPLVVPAGDVIVLGVDDTLATNGGVDVDYAYGSGWFLSNGADEVVLIDADGLVFDTVAYDGSPTFPDPTGAAMSLAPGSTSTGANDDGTNWCEASTTYGAGDRGTPGEANPICEDPEPELVFVHDIQGAGASAAIVGAVQVQAIVTSLFERDDALDGFFVQEEDADADADAATSEGIFVFCRGNCPSELAVGDVVDVIGDATEFFGMTQVDMTGGSVAVQSSGNQLPTAAVLSLPATGSTTAETTFESLEGMVVTSPNTLVVSEYFQLARFGQVVLTDAARPFQFTHTNEPSVAGYAAYLADLATRRIILDDDNNDNNDAISDGPDEAYAYGDGLSLTNRFRGGDTITNLTGVLHWSFAGSSGTDAWRVRPIDGIDNIFTSANPAPATPDDVGGSLTVASFNVLNFFATVDDGPNVCGPAGGQDCRGADSAAELVRQRDKIIAALVEMDADIVGLIELQNDEDASIRALVDGLNAVLGADTYNFVDTGSIGDDAIKVGFIYKPATVNLVGDFAILDTSVDPTFLDTKNRPALGQTFEEAATGERLTIAVNHLKSKGSPCDDVGDPGLNDGQANCAGTRAAAAAALASWLAGDPTGSGDPDSLIIGDLNAYAMEDAIRALTDAGYTDLIDEFDGSDAYSFVFDGQLGYLDHALANGSLLNRVTGTTTWSINADEINIFDYNDDIRDDGEASFERESGVLPVYAADPFRSSDHDPVIVGLQLADPRGDKMGAIDSLEALLPSGDRNTDRRINRAIDNIEQSLNPQWWDSNTTINTWRVFKSERAAVLQLELVVKSEVAQAAVAQEVIDVLVNADRVLARVAIIEAPANGVKPNNIARAEVEMTRAAQDTAAGQGARAINHYRNAWRFVT